VNTRGLICESDQHGFHGSLIYNSILFNPLEARIFVLLAEVFLLPTAK